MQLNLVMMDFVPIIEMIEQLAKECKKPDWTIEKKDLSEVKKNLKKNLHLI